MILIAYATKKGSTRGVAEAVATTMRKEGLEVEVRPAGDVRAVHGYEGVVLGGAIYMGRWHNDAKRFLRRHRMALGGMPIAVFGMGPRTLEKHDVAESRAQLDRALAEVPDVVPFSVTIFGGVVDPAQHHFPFNRSPATDARDWDAIRGWAREVAGRLPQSSLR